MCQTTTSSFSRSRSAGGVRGQSGAARVLVDEVAGRVTLVRGRTRVTHRCLVANVARAAIEESGVGQQDRLALRVQRVADRLAQAVAALGVADVPHPADAVVREPLRLGLACVSGVRSRVNALPRGFPGPIGTRTTSHLLDGVRGRRRPSCPGGR